MIREQPLGARPEASRRGFSRTDSSRGVGCAGAHGYSNPTGIIVFFHRCSRAGPFKACPEALRRIVADVGRGRHSNCTLNPVAVAIVHEGRRGCAAHSGHAVLGVVGQVVHQVIAHLRQGHVIPAGPTGAQHQVEHYLHLGGVCGGSDAPALLRPGGRERSLRPGGHLPGRDEYVIYSIKLRPQVPVAVVGIIAIDLPAQQGVQVILRAAGNGEVGGFERAVGQVADRDGIRSYLIFH